MTDSQSQGPISWFLDHLESQLSRGQAPAQLMLYRSQVQEILRATEFSLWGWEDEGSRPVATERLQLRFALIEIEQRIHERLGNPEWPEDFCATPIRDARNAIERLRSLGYDA